MSYDVNEENEEKEKLIELNVGEPSYESFKSEMKQASNIPPLKKKCCGK